LPLTSHVALRRARLSDDSIRVAAINSALALGTFDPDPVSKRPLPFGSHVRQWHTRYSVTFKPR